MTSHQQNDQSNIISQPIRFRMMDSNPKSCRIKLCSGLAGAVSVFRPSCQQCRPGAASDFSSARGGLTTSPESDRDIWTKYNLLDETFNQLISLHHSEYLIIRIEQK